MNTALAALCTALGRAAEHDSRVEAPAEAVLWCDPGREFVPLLPALRAALPQLLTLGEHDPALRQVPAVWLRAAAGLNVAGVAWDGDDPAILYLPGVARESLRAAEDCPAALRLLAWFVVGGALFGHVNSRDWTLRGFLSSKPAYGGLGLDVAQDEATRVALIAASAKLFEMPVAELRGRRLDAPWLHQLLAPDLVEDTLAWLGGSLRAEADAARFAAFQARAKAELKIDPAKLRPDAAAKRLLRREGQWGQVWQRFAAGGRGFHEDVAALLAPVEPPDLFTADPAIYASANTSREATLRGALARLADTDEATAREAVRRLAREHAGRRAGPWAARGRARLADAVHWLDRVASAPPLPSRSADGMAAAYAATGWEADDAALRALQAITPKGGAIDTLAEDRQAVEGALRALYGPRLQRDAAALQGLFTAAMPEPGQSVAGDAVLFVDGLRMDIGHRLAEVLRAQGAAVELGWRWTGFPTVTATCKPLASPAAGQLRGADAAEGFEPVAGDGKRVTQPVLVRELATLGWRTEETLVADERCWLEDGHFDKDGHAQGARMADSIDAAVTTVAARILRLVHMGRRLRVTTDHGWLLLPGGLPVARLPAGLTETRWRRCAVVKDGAATGATRLPWSWNTAVPVATAPGAHVFVSGAEYAHGGVSPQECVVPELLVSPLATARRAVIVAVEWSGLRLRVRADGGDGLSADLRLGADGDGVSIVDRVRQLDADGRTSLLVRDDAHSGAQAVLELRDAGGPVVTTRKVVVGG